MEREEQLARECMLQPWVETRDTKMQSALVGFQSLGLDGRRHGKTSLLALPSSVLITETDCFPTYNFPTYNFETLNHLSVCEMEMHFIVRLEML